MIFNIGIGNFIRQYLEMFLNFGGLKHKFRGWPTNRKFLYSPFLHSLPLAPPTGNLYGYLDAVGIVGYVLVPTIHLSTTLIEYIHISEKLKLHVFSTLNQMKTRAQCRPENRHERNETRGTASSFINKIIIQTVIFTRIALWNLPSFFENYWRKTFFSILERDLRSYAFFLPSLAT